MADTETKRRLSKSTTSEKPKVVSNSANKSKTKNLRLKTPSNKRKLNETPEKENRPGPSNEPQKEESVVSADEPDEVLSQTDSQSIDEHSAVANPHALRIKQNKELLKKVISLPFYDNQYPSHTMCTVKRHNFVVDEKKKKCLEMTAKYLPSAGTTCIICDSPTGDGGESELVDCQGNMNGGPKKLACKSKFHLNCIMKYNAGAFQFQYSALPECQNKLQCPLHCCSACNVNHRKQSAYVEELVECSTCLRAFHKETCVPAGSVEIDVTVTLGDRPVTFEMLVCPTHAPEPVEKNPKKVNKRVHIKACHHCNHEKDTKNEELVKCSTCVRSFHKSCVDMKTLDGKNIDIGKCDFCQCGDIIRLNIPVIVNWKGEFWLAFSRPWASYPVNQRNDKSFQQVGKLVVHWILEKKTVSSIVSLNDVAPLEKQYLKIPKDAETRAAWKKVYRDFDLYSRFPNLLKKVNKIGQTSKYFEKTSPRLLSEYITGQCKCEGPNRCSTSSCMYKVDGCECPPECAKIGRGCNNRNVSDKKISGSIELRQAPLKGYGIFAIAPIKRGEFIGEYVGEIIDKAEKEKRVMFVEKTFDFQGNHYLMEKRDGLYIDASRYGNLTRYINHSCNPNCVSYQTKMFVRNGTDEYSMFDSRIYIEADKDIDVGEEVTFNYTMDSAAVPECWCGAENCTGRLTSKTNADDQDTSIENEEDEDESGDEGEEKGKKNTVAKVKRTSEHGQKKKKSAVEAPKKKKSVETALPSSKRTRRPPLRLQDADVEQPAEKKPCLLSESEIERRVREMIPVAIWLAEQAKVSTDRKPEFEKMDGALLRKVIIAGMESISRN